MKNVIAASVMSLTLGLVSLMAQEKKDMPMNMRKGMGGMMKGQSMMRSEDTKGMGTMMGNMSGMMGDMGQMMSSGKMSPEEMSQMSKMMGDMSGMMKQMSERMKKGTGKTQ